MLVNLSTSSNELTNRIIHRICKTFNDNHIDHNIIYSSEELDSLYLRYREESSSLPAIMYRLEEYIRNIYTLEEYRNIENNVIVINPYGISYFLYKYLSEVPTTTEFTNFCKLLIAEYHNNRKDFTIINLHVGDFIPDVGFIKKYNKSPVNESLNKYIQDTIMSINKITAYIPNHQSFFIDFYNMDTFYSSRDLNTLISISDRLIAANYQIDRQLNKFDLFHKLSHINIETVIFNYFADMIAFYIGYSAGKYEGNPLYGEDIQMLFKLNQLIEEENIIRKMNRG